MAMLTNNQALNPKNKGGRPSLAAPPLTAAETRALIAIEIVKTTPNATKLRHLQKLLKSQEHAEDQAAAERANRLLAEANELKRSDTTQLKELTVERTTLRDTVASLREQLARVQEHVTRLTHERDTLMRERDALQATVNNLQPQADALARIKSDVQGELDCLFNADEKALSLQADLETLKKEERTMTVLGRMREILLQLQTLQHAYRVGEGVI
jgi:uncharacterized coiled-coil DUF342 family protein